MTTVALLGAGGFVGSQVRGALERRGALVLCLPAPRLTTAARDLVGMVAEVNARMIGPDVSALAGSLAKCDAIVNAAGVAAAAGDGDALFGANALLPGLLAALAPVGSRFVHISSAAVQGRRTLLDESTETNPFSPYSHSKALGEAVVRHVRPAAVCYRPTSVHGPGRDVTRSLAKILRSPAASVAGTRDAPTPQVLVQNVGDAAAYLAIGPDSPPSVVLHPSEGITTGDLVRLVGGRVPVRLPVPAARLAVSLGFLVGRMVPTSAGLARRLEMLWFGQDQVDGWLDTRWSPPLGRDTWKDLA